MQMSRDGGRSGGNKVLQAASGGGGWIKAGFVCKKDSLMPLGELCSVEGRGGCLRHGGGTKHVLGKACGLR